MNELLDNRNGTTMFHRAAKHGYASAIESLIRKIPENTVNINRLMDDNGDTPLVVALSARHANVADTLLEYQISHRIDLRCFGKDKEAVDGTTALHAAAASGLSLIVKRLLKLPKTFEGSANKLKDNYGLTALHCAALNGDAKVVEELLGFDGKHPCNVNAQDMMGKTPTHIAAEKGHTECVKYMLEEGADPNVIDKRGMTPVHYAAMKGFDECVMCMLTKGVDPNVTDVYGRTILHVAAENGKDSVALDLLSLYLTKDRHEIRAHATDKVGRTPMHLAALNGHVDLVQTLRVFKVDPNAKDNRGKTAMDLAKEMNHRKVIQELQSEFVPKRIY